MEVGLPYLRTSLVDSKGNNQALKEALDGIEDKKGNGSNSPNLIPANSDPAERENPKAKSFNKKDLVLQKVTLNTTKLTDGKFEPNWEGPYAIVSSSGTRAHCLIWMARQSKTHGMHPT